jgi:hypothetical protein
VLDGASPPARFEFKARARWHVTVPAATRVAVSRAGWRVAVPAAARSVGRSGGRSEEGLSPEPGAGGTGRWRHHIAASRILKLP